MSSLAELLTHTTERQCCTRAAALCVFLLCIASLSTEYYQLFLAQGIGFRLGAGGIFTTSTVCVGKWFVRRRRLASLALAAGLVRIFLPYSGPELRETSGVIFPMFFDKTIAQVELGSALRYAGFIIGTLLALSCFLVRARMPRKKWDPNVKLIDLGLFKDAPFGRYKVGSFLVLLVRSFEVTISQY